MNTFFKGTIILVLAAFLSECVEFFVNMILARELQEQGMGIYMSILPFIFLIFILASLEFPVSISKFVAENKRDLHYGLLKHSLYLGAVVMVLMTIITLAVLSIPGLFASYDPKMKFLMLALIPIATFSSIARGYFMGIQKMSKIAISNFIRKAFQFLFLFAVFRLFHFNEETSLFIALCALIASELIVFLYLVSTFILHMGALRSSKRRELKGDFALKQLLGVSLPTVGLRIFHAVTNAIQPILIQAALIKAGFSAVEATEHFGMLMGVAMTIGFFPAFIAHSFMVMLIPTVSEAHSKNETGKLRELLHQSIWLTLIYGSLSVFIMYVFAEPMTSLFFSSTTASYYLQLLWPYFFFHFFIIPMQAFLIGLGLVKDALYHTLWSHLVSFILIYLLGSQSALNMTGIILAMNMGGVLLALLHYFTICRKIGVNLLLSRQSEVLS